MWMATWWHTFICRQTCILEEAHNSGESQVSSLRSPNDVYVQTGSIIIYT